MSLSLVLHYRKAKALFTRNDFCTVCVIVASIKPIYVSEIFLYLIYFFFVYLSKYNTWIYQTNNDIFFF